MLQILRKNRKARSKINKDENEYLFLTMIGNQQDDFRKEIASDNNATQTDPWKIEKPKKRLMSWECYILFFAMIILYIKFKNEFFLMLAMIVLFGSITTRQKT